MAGIVPKTACLAAGKLRRPFRPCSHRLPHETDRVAALFVLAPLFFVFELWQLIIAERYLGLKHIARGTDPRELGLSEITAAFWSLVMLAYWVWMVAMLFQPLGRFQFLTLVVVTVAGFTVRRGCGLKWVLVVLTFEGSVRVGMLLSICVLVWRRLL
jgi:hypothetical protein